MFKDYEGKTEEEARIKAIEELGLEDNDFDVEILENVKKSLFKKSYVKIRVYYGDEDGEEAVESISSSETLSPVVNKSPLRAFSS